MTVEPKGALVKLAIDELQSQVLSKKDWSDKKKADMLLKIEELKADFLKET